MLPNLASKFAPDRCNGIKEGKVTPHLLLVLSCKPFSLGVALQNRIIISHRAEGGN